MKDKNYNNTESLIIVLYYALTVISSVGYGDYYPVSYLEMLIAVFCMMVGVIVFSIIKNLCSLEILLLEYALSIKSISFFNQFE